MIRRHKRHKIDRYEKAYNSDGGTDIIMDKDVVFPPGEMTVVELTVPVNPPSGHLAIICPRSSYALQGIFIANCPIDAHYTGYVKAIVFNSGKNVVSCKKGERFCQFIVLKCIPNLYNAKCRKLGRRKTNGWGSSGK